MRANYMLHGQTAAESLHVSGARDDRGHSRMREDEVQEELRPRFCAKLRGRIGQGRSTRFLKQRVSSER
jgi:hypothetical protein